MKTIINNLFELSQTTGQTIDKINELISQWHMTNDKVAQNSIYKQLQQLQLPIGEFSRNSIYWHF